VNGDAAARYKEIAGRNTDAVRRMRERDRAVAEELRAKLGDAERALAEATAREQVSRVGVRLHWESATEALWAERWLQVGPQPNPAPPPPGSPLTADRADAEVGRTYDVLREALRKAGLLPRRNRLED
jgi:hypothetical protein